jgi:hypothetical protein|tara:strand:- start:200 stop:727 length:528 start_codon:yes stop_codon:yes gene_type:complete
MALWGNSDNVTSAGTVTLNYATGICTGSGTAFGASGSAQEGDVIRFGDRSGTYFGDAVIVSIASATQLTIGSTAGLSGVAIAATSFTVSQCPVSSIGDVTYSEGASGTEDKAIYGIAAEGLTNTATSKYEVDHGGWVGVTTYVDQHGELRVKKEVLVAMSGITTGNAPVYDTNPF